MKTFAQLPRLQRAGAAPRALRRVLVLLLSLFLLEAGSGSSVPAQTGGDQTLDTGSQNPAPTPLGTLSPTEQQRREENMRILNDLVRKKKAEFAAMSPEERRQRIEQDQKEAAETRQKEREQREGLAKALETGKPPVPAPALLKPGEPGKAGEPGKVVEAGKPGEAGKAEKPHGLTFTGISCVLQVRPFSQSVRLGQRFATEIALYSENAFEFDKLDLRIAYSPTDVRPLRVFDYPLADVLDPKAPPVYSPGKGLLTYSASLNRPVKALESAPVLYVLWEAVGENANSELSLGRYGQAKSMNSAVYLGGKNLLEPKTFLGASCVGGSIAIASEGKDKRAGLLQVSNSASLDAATSPDSAVRLLLKGPEPKPAPGTEFAMEVFLDNPSYAAFDQVRLAVRFDPRKVEVLDDDAGGWIRRGVNVSDAHAHGYFPFSMHNANSVSNSLGRISYDMGFSAPRPTQSGSLIRIRCRAKTADAAESFRISLGRENRDWFTDVRLAGRSILARNDSSHAQPAAVSLAQ